MTKLGMQDSINNLKDKSSDKRNVNKTANYSASEVVFAIKL